MNAKPDKKAGSFDCQYLGRPAILDTEIETVFRCNAPYSNAPSPLSDKPCAYGFACFDKINNLCRVMKPKKRNAGGPFSKYDDTQRDDSKGCFA